MAKNKYLNRSIPPTASRGQKELAKILDEIFRSNGADLTIHYEYPIRRLTDSETAIAFGVYLMTVDFYIAELRMAIEYQGAQHYGQGRGGDVQPQRDSLKREYLREIGVSLVEIPDKGKLTKETVCSYLGM